VADTSMAELLLPLTKFLTADSCAVVHSTAVQTTGTLRASSGKATADRCIILAQYCLTFLESIG